MSLVWTALAQEGLAANLQHYNPLIDEGIVQKFAVPSHWSLKAQFVFGSAVGKPKEKTFIPLKDRLIVFGGSSANKNGAQ